MELKYKRDFEKARRQWADFWEGRMNRPALYLRAPKSKKNGLPQLTKSYSYGQSGRTEAWLDDLDRYFEGTLFFAEAIPAVPLGFAPDHFSALLGAEIHVHPENPDTAWVEPFVEDWEDTEIALRKDGFWWDRTFEFIEKFKQRFEGRAMLCPPNIQGGLDCLSAIRGNQRLLFDLIDCPEKVHAALKQVSKAVKELQKIYIDEMEVSTWGSVNRHLFYSPNQLIGVPQCDFSCMISRDMFNRFQMPALREELEQLGYSDYHLDGPDAIQHLEAICELDKISVIQWQPGAAGMDKDWGRLYKKIDSLGKGLIIVGNDALEKGEALWKTLDSRQLALFTDCEDADHAKAAIERFENMADLK